MDHQRLVHGGRRPRHRLRRGACYAPPYAAPQARLSVAFDVDGIRFADTGTPGMGDGKLLLSGGSWRLDGIQRHGTYHQRDPAGRLVSLRVDSTLTPLYGQPGYALRIRLRNRSGRALGVRLLPELIPGPAGRVPLGEWGWMPPEPAQAGLGRAELVNEGLELALGPGRGGRVRARRPAGGRHRRRLAPAVGGALAAAHRAARRPGTGPDSAAGHRCAGPRRVLPPLAGQRAGLPVGQPGLRHDAVRRDLRDRRRRAVRVRLGHRRLRAALAGADARRRGERRPRIDGQGRSGRPLRDRPRRQRAPASPTRTAAGRW